jgi:hypothetical protein
MYCIPPDFQKNKNLFMKQLLIILLALISLPSIAQTDIVYDVLPELVLSST